MTKILKSHLGEFVAITKALADETRARIVLALVGQELCACQITELFDLAPSTMSQHLLLLRKAGLVNSRKNGRWIYYSLPNDDAPVAVLEIIGWLRKNIGKQPLVMEDQKKLRKILMMDPSELCKAQCKN